jgi:hypothetical protein
VDLSQFPDTQARLSRTVSKPTLTHVSLQVPYLWKYLYIVAGVTLLLVYIVAWQLKVRPSIFIVAYLRKRDVVLLHCYNRANATTKETSDMSQYVSSIVTYSGFYTHDGTLLHSKSQYTTVKHSRKVFEHTYTSDPHGLGTLIHVEFFQQDLLWQSSNTHSHSCSQKASKYTSGQSIVRLSVHLHTTTAPRRIIHR